jgi:photosystem II stability/assembly factor-like uncharacterized protein
LFIKDTNLFAGTQGVYLFNRQSSTWSSVSNGLPSSAIIYCFAQKGNNIFIGLSGGEGIYLSNDNGLNWTAVNNGLSNYQLGFTVMSITTFGSYIFATTSSGYLYVSTDNCNNWALVKGLPNQTYVQPHSVIIKDSTLFAGCGFFSGQTPYSYSVIGELWKFPLNTLH